MAGFVEVIQKYFAPYFFYIFVLFLIVLFGLAGYYGYSKYTESQTKFSDVANANRRGGATIYLFHVNWCPHCKTAMPEWQNFVEEYNGKEINGYQIDCVDIDCTKETSDVKAAIEKYSIESYPTVKMIKDNQVIEFDSKIKKTTLEQFAETMLNQN